MAARAGMADLILEVRRMANAGTADFTTGWGESLFSDDHLQAALDRTRRDLNRVALTPEPEYTGGTPLYLDYYAPVGDLEAYTGDEAVFVVEDGSGNAAGTATYTADYRRGVVRFNADQGGTAYYLRARTYSLPLAAADIWRQKAAQHAERFAVSTDNHTLHREQLIAHCLKMAAQFEMQAGVQSVEMRRTDLQ